MTSSNSLRNKAIFQYLMIAVVVLGIGFYKRQDIDVDDYANVRLMTTPTTTPTSTLAINHPKAEYVNKYPEFYFGTDTTWDIFKKNDHSENILYEGKGYIYDNNLYNVSTEFILRHDGTIVGRYYNENGTKLDLNGYVDSSTGDLYINLGHAKHKTLSNWKLHFPRVVKDKPPYLYIGEWGIKKQPSRLIINRK